MISATLLHLHLSDLERVVRHGWWQWRISRKAGWGLCFETNSMKCCHTITHQIRSRFEQNLLAELLFFGSMILKSLRSSLALRCMMYTYMYIYTWYVYLYIYGLCSLLEETPKMHLLLEHIPAEVCLWKLKMEDWIICAFLEVHRRNGGFFDLWWLCCPL